ncbi:SDR family NAD(P)-dependent oxidoreductase [Pseudomonas batumici]|nr:SDR family NAD(P)-dependent oxidoreductase [Pseudomonas batumici]
MDFTESARQHAAYFEALHEIVLSIFDRMPVENQPAYIVHTGCGDASLLKSLYEFVEARSARGRLLDSHPLRLIGIDSDRTMLECAAAGLANLDHLLIQASIDDPREVSSQLRSHGIDDVDAVLYVRWPEYPDSSSLTPEGITRSWVEYMGRWADGVGRCGLIQLAECSMGSDVAGEASPRGDLPCDSSHGPSSRLPDWAERHLMGAAAVGLFAQMHSFHKFPQQKLFAQAVLSLLERRAYIIRYARESDVPALMVLEEQCWAAGIRVSEEAIRERVIQYAQGQLVLEVNGVVKGCIYSQRIEHAQLLDDATFETAWRLHAPQGPIVQLLALNISSDAQDQQFGDQLLEFMLQRCSLLTGVGSVVGVTRCKDHGKHEQIPMFDYIGLRNGRGELIDTVLRFHERHGATIRKLMPGYRPADDVNNGNGVLVHYDLANRLLLGNLQSRLVTPAAVSSGENDRTGHVGQYVSRLIRSRLQLDNDVPLDLDQPLMEMGLDSADLLELATSISGEFNVTLTAMFFFENNTCNKVIVAVGERADASQVVVQSHKSDHQSVPVPRVGLDIAIVGAACRLPFDIETLDGFWQLLLNGEEVIGTVPEGRWQWPVDIEPHTKHRGIDQGAFLSDVARFDGAFFRISPHEAELMDPQQRILLELSWQCLEDAGYCPSSLAGSRTGVYVGASGSDYRLLVDRTGAGIEGHSGLGTSMSILPNRISYFYDFCGPSMLIDTACSSSLVAVHQAIESLRAGNCTQAMVAGINIMCDPSTTVAYYRAGMLSTDGRCRTFDASANGYVRAEGAVMLLLKPYEYALRDNDNIYAVLKGSAVNHGGLAGGLTVPNPRAQAELVMGACRNADIDINSLGYIEAHGTGTSLGDPIEVAGLKSAFERFTADGDPVNARCGLGSLKTNFGHLEAAAGIAGLLKAMLCLRHNVIPGSLNFDRLNPLIDLSGTPFHVVDATTAWPASHEEPRRAGVSSFGSGGTNAHVIVEEHRLPLAVETPGLAVSPQRLVLILLCAKSAQRLLESAHSLRTCLSHDRFADKDLVDIAYTLQVGRESMEHRLALTATSIRELHEKLDAYIAAAAVQVEYGDVHVGEVKKGSEGLIALGQDADFLNLLNIWIAKGKHSPLLALWVRGLDVDWSSLYREGGAYEALSPRRVSLATYSFERTPHWVGRLASANGRIGSVATLCESTRASSFPDDSVTGGASTEPAFLVPVWDAWVGESVDEPSADERIVVLGGTARQKSSILERYPQARFVAFEEGEGGEALIERLRAHEVIEHIVWITPQQSDTSTTMLDNELIAGQQRGVINGFRLIKALLQLGYGRKTLGWTVVTWQTQAVHPQDVIDPTHASVHGLIGSLAKEHAQWKIRLVDLPGDDEWPLEQSMRLPADGEGNAYAYRQGEWHRQVLVYCDVPSLQPAPYRKAGVYVVIGGAGGLGEVFSRVLIERYQAQVIWIGRRPVDAVIEQKINRLGALGVTPTYVRADATDYAELEGAYRQIKARYGAIHGVIHAAITLQDKTIANMDEERFRSGLAAKVDVSVRLGQVFAQEPLDFVLFFSSIQSFFKPAGQSNYAAGCTFKDAYAHALGRAWPCPVKCMNWGYWGTVGIVASPAYRARLASQGIGSIEPAIGMDAVDVLLQSPFERLAFMQLSKKSAVAKMIGDEWLLQLPAGGQSASDAQQSPAVLSIIDRPVERDTVGMECAVSSELLARLLFVQLRSLGFEIDAEGDLHGHNVAHWKKNIGLSALYERWLHHGVRIAHPYLRGDMTGSGSFDTVSMSDAQLWGQWNEHKRELSAQPGMRAQAEFVEAALRALPDILAGRRAATDVLFARGSLDFVSAVYRGNPVSDFFNDALVEELIAYIEERVRNDPAARIRILEIGAGTGATTARIISSLGALRECIDEYCYTDLSKVFLLDAQQQFAAHADYFNYTLFNVEHPLCEQAIEVGKYDVVVASNVLHATQNIRQTLRNTKACLKRQGLLLLNELSGISLIHHLTFGLLEGWWRYQDKVTRIAGSPALETEQWRRVLEGEGFKHIHFPVLDAHRFGQQIVVATSDGWVRQKGRSAVSDSNSVLERFLKANEKDARAVAAEAVDTGPIAFPARSAASLEETLDRVIRRMSPVIGMHMEKIDVDTDFMVYGIDSILSMKVLHELELEFSIQLSNSMLFEHRTIADLSTAIVRIVSAQPREASSARTLDVVVGERLDTQSSDDRTMKMLEDFRDGNVKIEEVEGILDRWTK